MKFEQILNSLRVLYQHTDTVPPPYRLSGSINSSIGSVFVRKFLQKVSALWCFSSLKIIIKLKSSLLKTVVCSKENDVIILYIAEACWEVRNLIVQLKITLYPVDGICWETSQFIIL